MIRDDSGNALITGGSPSFLSSFDKVSARLASQPSVPIGGGSSSATSGTSRAFAMAAIVSSDGFPLPAVTSDTKDTDSPAFSARSFFLSRLKAKKRLMLIARTFRYTGSVSFFRKGVGFSR